MAITLKKASLSIRIITLTLWVAAAVAGIGGLLWYPDSFTAANIASVLLRFQGEVLLVYLVMSALRGLSLLPSTPLVIAGTLIYPDQPWLVLLVSISGIAFSSSMIYFFSELLGTSEYFEKKKPDLAHHIHNRLEHPTGFLFVAAWAFFPFVPTDAVCYVAGTVKMDYLKFLGAVLLGEFVLCSIYIFLGGSLFNSLFS